MRTKTIMLAFLAVTAGVFAYTRSHNATPSDLRDAVADRAIDTLKTEAGAEASGVSITKPANPFSVGASAGRESSDTGIFSASPAGNDITQNGLAESYYLMAPHSAYTAQEAGVNSGYLVLLSHAVIPDKTALLKAVNFWNTLLGNAGVKLYSLNARGVQSGYTLEFLYSGGPAIKSFDSSSLGLVYKAIEDAAKGAGETASKIEAAGGKVLAKFTVRQGDKFSFAVYFRSGAPAVGKISKSVDMNDAAFSIYAILEGAHQVGAVFSGTASYLANAESSKSDYKGNYKSAEKAVSALAAAAERRSTVTGLEIYSNEGPEGRVYSYLVFWKGWGF